MAISEDTRTRYIRRQIEQIRDTTDSRVIEVVVKVRSEQHGDDFVSIVADGLRRRGLYMSSQDLLPAKREILERPPTTRARKKGSQTLRGGSLASQLALARYSPSGEFKEAAQSAISSFLSSAAVQESVAALAAVPNRQKPPPTKPKGFWTSVSAVMQVRGEDLERIAEQPDIEDIFINQRLHVPPVASPKIIPADIEENQVSAWGLRMSGALASWGAFGHQGEEVVVGLLDTGVDPDHPDLAGKIIGFAEFDSNGGQVQDPKVRDTDIHGTHCAGTIVGGNESGRWIGMAPKAKIKAGLVLNGSAGGTHAQILAGMEWLINEGVDVISMSLGGLIMSPEAPSTYTRAILSAVRAGIPVVTAIGNDGSQLTGAPGNDFMAFSVGAMDHRNRAAGFSGGRTQVIRESTFFPQDALPLVYSKPDISAPGVAVLSSVPTRDRYRYLNGTSMATPHVAGAIALLLSATTIRNKVPDSQRAFLIQDLLIGSAEDLGEAGQNHRFGFGRLDILKAIGWARQLGYKP
ncbi:S8 family serine peptidase [Sinorhizobium medicae]|uniref:S8 family serine peptidase n=1 Tax=Sinorhizobium medicae TaxID=110321 RepID=UPI001296B0A2|nr:S8 family serine peptidase [Sinorhizobium medicae]MQV46317.1 S8 family serine peptidase [Sinorhizobium medicae]MQV54048.1 S8 family serine peptidase [Sinorhizobium medicae]MQV71687.1 S8 family serine peptidase [Sinorhizobium medicae]